MPSQLYNAEAAGLLATHFPMRMEASYVWARAISGLQNTPGLRGLWSFSSIDEHNKVVDMSGQGRVLMPGTAPTLGTNGLLSYLDFIRASSMYLKRPTEPGIAITGAMTVWAWIYFDVESTGNETGIISKWYTIGNLRSYLLYKTAGNAFTFDISTDGTAVKTVGDAVANYTISKWWFVLGRFIPSTELALLVGEASGGTYNWYRNVAAIPATIFVSTEALEIGRGSRTNYLDGRMSSAGLVANALTDVQAWNIFSQTRPLLM